MIAKRHLKSAPQEIVSVKVEGTLGVIAAIFAGRKMPSEDVIDHKIRHLDEVYSGQIPHSPPAAPCVRGLVKTNIFIRHVTGKRKVYRTRLDSNAGTAQFVSGRRQ
jgi:hypothetical protein